MTEIGVVFRPQLPPERLREVARAAEDAGLAQLWLWEDCFLEGGIASAAAALAWTDRLRVGVGLLPVPLRNAALTAMEAASLHRMFPGRVDLVLGHGVQGWMEQIGARAASPLTLLREHLGAVGALLRGERLTTQGRYVQLNEVALDWPPARPPALLAGASGPKSLKLSGELADGTLLTSATDVERLRQARQSVDEGRTAAGRSDPHRFIVYLATATGEGAEARLAAELARNGLQSTQGLGAAGDAQQVAAAVRALAAAGADTVVLEPTADEPDPLGFVRFAAEEVAPLVR